MPHGLGLRDARTELQEEVLTRGGAQVENGNQEAAPETSREGKDMRSSKNEHRGKRKKKEEGERERGSREGERVRVQRPTPKMTESIPPTRGQNKARSNAPARPVRVGQQFWSGCGGAADSEQEEKGARERECACKDPHPR